MEESNKEGVEAPTGPNVDSRNPSLASLDDSVYLPLEHIMQIMWPLNILHAAHGPKREGKGGRERESGSEYFPCFGSFPLSPSLPPSFPMPE